MNKIKLLRWRSCKTSQQGNHLLDLILGVEKVKLGFYISFNTLLPPKM